MKQKYIRYHLGGWVLVIAYNLINVWRSNHHSAPANMLLQFFFCCSMVGVFYYEFFWIYPRFLTKAKMLQLILALLPVPLIFSVCHYLPEQVLYTSLTGSDNRYMNPWYYLLDNVYYSVCVTVVSAVIWIMQQSFDQQQKNEMLIKEKHQVEQAFLKAQIDPLFLYNVLNFMHAMAYPVSDPLANAIGKLSQLMGYVLHQNAEGKVELRKEIDYLQNYTDLYRLRFEDHFFVHIKAEGDLTGKRIAPFLLITLIENAFKHGLVNDAQRPVKIHLKVIGFRLMVTVSNKVNRNPENQGGIGLINTRRRLAFLYPNRHELLIADNGQSYKVTLNIDLEY